MQEYMNMGHAELVPAEEQEKPEHEGVLSSHACSLQRLQHHHKDQGCFQCLCKVLLWCLFEWHSTCSTNSPPLTDRCTTVLCFRLHRVAIMADVSKMYRAVKLKKPDRNLSRFVWSSNPKEILRNYRMTRVTFGVSASSFAANMSIKQNAIDFAHEYPSAAKAADQESFYVDDVWQVLTV